MLADIIPLSLRKGGIWYRLPPCLQVGGGGNCPLCLPGSAAYVRVTCDVGYLCANFNLPIGLSVLDLGPTYATDVKRQTDVRRASSLNAPYLRGGA